MLLWDWHQSEQHAHHLAGTGHVYLVAMKWIRAIKINSSNRLQVASSPECADRIATWATSHSSSALRSYDGKRTADHRRQQRPLLNN